MKKLKHNKRFKPLSHDDGDEFFPNGIFEFNISKLLTFIRENSSLFAVDQVNVSTTRSFTPTHLDERTIRFADLSVPIVLAEIAPGRFNVIDGHHRLERAFREGLITIPAVQVGVDQHTAFLTSQKAYNTYVKYWNDKVDEIERRAI